MPFDERDPESTGFDGTMQSPAQLPTVELTALRVDEAMARATRLFGIPNSAQERELAFLAAAVWAVAHELALARANREAGLFS